MRTDSQINSANAHLGQSFNANLTRDLVVAAATGKEEAVIHAETAITFTTTAEAKAK